MNFTSPTVILTIALITGVCIKSNAQVKDTALLKSMLNSKNFVFKATEASPQSGRTVHLTPGYELTLKEEQISSYLPYYGRAYSAPISSSELGLEFKSTDFEYKVTKRKKNGWDVYIKPHDAKDVKDMYLTVYENGNSNLSVNSINRQAMSFRGYISETKKQ